MKLGEGCVITWRLPWISFISFQQSLCKNRKNSFVDNAPLIHGINKWLTDSWLSLKNNADRRNYLAQYTVRS